MSVDIVRITTPGNMLEFYTPNKCTRDRADNLYVYEPETIEWLNSFEDGAIFWDIGANIGSYSCYAAIEKKANIVAFEPNPFNIYVLARNILLNKLEERITIFPLPLFDKQQIGPLNMTYCFEGGSLATFIHDYGCDGKNLNIQGALMMFGMSADMIRALYKMPYPNYIKIDVDGIEDIIINGLKNTLSSDTIRSIIVELNENLPEQIESIHSMLTHLNYSLAKRHRTSSQDTPGRFSKVTNYMYVKNKH